jgi:hypothetical protein
MGQIAGVCQRFARKRLRSVLMTHRFSICENVSDAGLLFERAEALRRLRRGKNNKTCNLRL